MLQEEENSLNHLAIIMDGNSSWAKERGLPTHKGHQQGSKTLENLLPALVKTNIKHITLYGFSSENWQRPKLEINFLFEIFQNYLTNKIDLLVNNNVKLKVIGRLSKLPNHLQRAIEKAEEQTKNCNKINLNIAISYGAKEEIIDAVNKIIQDEKIDKQKSIQDEEFNKYLYNPEMPDVDLLIRTGNHLRLSNFLLWQSAYAELYFINKYWPNITKDDISEAINNYQKRIRKFGKR